MIRNVLATALLSGALGAAVIGIGAGTAQADPNKNDGCWPYACDVFQGPPGQNPFGPPGQVKKAPFLGPFPNPVYGVPPGHW